MPSPARASRRLLLLALLSLVAAGCGSTSTAAPASSPTPLQANICQVFTKDELKAVMGQELGSAQAANLNSDDKQPGCNTPTADGTGAFGVYIDRSNNIQDAAVKFQQGPSSAGASPIPVANLADQALLVFDSNGLNNSKEGVLGMRKGAVLILVTVENAKTLPTGDTMRGLGQKLLDRADLKNAHI